MIASAHGQRHAYKGEPPRAWVDVEFIGANGSVETVELIADTGCPCAVIVSEEQMQRLRHALAAGLSSNFGDLQGAWMRITATDLGLDEHVVGYGSDAVARSASRSHPDFGGLLGLPLLRKLGFGGDGESFWIGDVA